MHGEQDEKMEDRRIEDEGWNDDKVDGQIAG